MQVYEVSQVNEYLRQRFEEDEFLSGVFIRGEVSNYKLYPSGHHYFTLKDASSAMRCVMFRGNAFRLRFRPENGMKVIAFGRISVFPRDGAYQLYCTEMTPDGVGDLHVAFEQLKAKLQAEGLFAQDRKKPLPRFPHRIAIITSAAGAALRYANCYRVADLIITGRGGGSIEDLWAFNDERVARAIAESEIPVISAVGHEPDFTISDFVADLRAATPSNAAELAVPDQTELRQELAAKQTLLLTLMQKRLKAERQHVAVLAGSRSLRDPMNYLNDRRMLTDYLQRRLNAAAQREVSASRERFVRLTAKLDAMSPLKVLGRGYSFARDERGSVVRSVHQLTVGETLRLEFADGCANAQITDLEDAHEERIHDL